MPTEIIRSLSYDTAVGRFDVTAAVTLKFEGKTEVILKSVVPKQKLPEGMTVQRCRAAVLSISGDAKLSSLTFSVFLDGDLEGHPCTGQGLDAQEWSDNGKLVVVGTEDGEWLDNRLPSLQCNDKAIVSYSPISMTLELTNIPIITSASFHFIIAENNDPEDIDASAWFAVDCPHHLLLSTA